jgi:DNA-binding Lrp family transcriptional regulator
MTHSGLDRVDLKILEVLQVDGRITNQKLAKLVSLSPSACLIRMRMLESAGLINGYRAQIALERVRTLMLIHAEVSMKGHTPSVFEHFEAVIAQIPEIVVAARISGHFDYWMKVVVTDMEEWKDISQAMLKETSVDKLLTHVVMQEVKPYAGVPINASEVEGRRARLDKQLHAIGRHRHRE